MENRTTPSGISVVICCYNSEARIEETLRHLAFQKTEISWEVIVVDNGSTDNTSRAAIDYWSKFGLQGVTFNVIPEPIPGLSTARSTGVRKSQYDIILFCDDDNWLAPDYLQIAFEDIRRQPKAAVVGGWCDGVFEIPLSASLEPLTGALAVGRHGKQNGPTERVNGAGMIFRKSVYEEIEEKAGVTFLHDRKGNQLTSGGDTELCWRAKFAGHEVVFNDKLWFQHYMPKGRLHRGYFFRLCLTNVAPVIILAQYKAVFDAPEKPFSSFWKREVFKELKKSLYFTPRIFIGKYQFYSFIFFLQSWKIILLLTFRFGNFSRMHRTLRELRTVLSK